MSDEIDAADLELVMEIFDESRQSLTGEVDIGYRGDRQVSTEGFGAVVEAVSDIGAGWHDRAATVGRRSGEDAQSAAEQVIAEI